MMQSRIRNIIFFVGGLFAIIALAFPASIVHAANLTVPLQIPLPDKNVIEVCAGEKCKGVAEYVASAYRFLVGFAAVLAVLALTWGGIRWLTSGGESSKIEEARKVITNAIIGLLLALGSYTILLTINPALTAFNPVVIKPIKPIDFSIYDWELSAIGGSKDQTAQAVPVTGCPSNPTVSFLGKTYTKSMFGEHWADVLCHTKISFFLVNKKTHVPEYEALVDVHEMTHKLNSGGQLYIGNGKYLDFDESEKITLDDVVKRLPQVLRDGDKGRFDLYLNTKMADLTKNIGPRGSYEGGVGKQNNGRPVDGILNDFSAYDGNAKSFAEIYEKNLPGKKMSEMSDYHGPPSFVAYGLALAKTLEDKDKEYLKNDKFKKTLKALIEDGMKSYKTAARIAPGEIEEQTKKMYDTLRTHADADDLRDLARRWYNVPPHPNWTSNWLGF